MIKNIVNGLIEISGSNDPFEICAYLDMIVIQSNLGSEIHGFFQKTPDGTELLHINSVLDESTKKYVCAHELGHAILEPEYSIGFFLNNPLLVKSKSEIKADRFAAELLIRDNLLLDYEGFMLEQIAITEELNIELLKLKFNVK